MFEQAVRDLRAIGLDVIVHVILFLPGETQSDMYQTISCLNRMDIQGIKLQLLHILKETDLADYYETHPFYIPQMEDYFQVLGNCVGMLRPDIVIHRITGDGPKELLIAPLWTRGQAVCAESVPRLSETPEHLAGKELYTCLNHLHFIS